MGASTSKSMFADIIAQLLQNDVESNDHDFWDDLWKSQIGINDIFSIISPDDVRKLIHERPKNLQTIFTQAVAQLYQVVETPYPVYFEQALTCARILTRMLPIMLECDAKLVKDLFWNRQKSQRPKSSTDTQADSVVTSDGTTNLATEVVETITEVDTEPLAVILVNSIFHLLFLPDFTIDDPNIDFNEEDLQTQQFKTAIMWAPGVGSSEKSVVVSSSYDKNRVDILRLMIAAFSDSLYQNPDTYDSCASMWLEVGTSVDAPYAEIVFYSLMNVVLGYDPIGWGVPYGNLMASDTAKLLMETAVQALLILLDYGNPIAAAESSTAAAPPPSEAAVPSVPPDETDSPGFNIFRRLLGSIDSPDQLNFIYRGFVRLLNNLHESQNTYLPYSVTRIEIEQELLVLLWKCLEEMPAFMPFVLRSCDVTELLVPVTYLLLESRKDASRLGMVYLCTFILLKLSGERSFGVALNKPYALRLPVDLPLFTGSHADLLIIVLHKMIVSGLDKLSALYNCFLTIICNVSPYCKCLSAVSSVKLVNLFQLFTSPRFLYAAEANHAHVAILLETFNNIVQYQYEGNANMVYALVRRRDAFDSLYNLTLPLALEAAVDLASKKAKTPDDRKRTTNTGERGAEEPAIESKPTDVISTKSVERRLGEVGEMDTTVSGGSGKESSTREGEEVKAAAAELRFVPTQEWLDSVKAELPLNTILRLLRHLVPQVEEMASNGSVEETQVLEFIHRTTMVGLLPVPHPIVIRKYQPNKYTSLWFTAFLWGVVFMHNQEIPLFDGRSVKLFIVQSAG